MNTNGLIKDLPWLGRYTRWLILSGCIPQTKPEHADPVMVLGIPRSGTSIVAKLLQELGVSMGFRVQPPDENNPTGYYEDRDLIEVHDAWCNKMIDDRTAQIVASYFFKLRQSIGVRWGFKAPRYVAWLPVLTEWMPHLRIILCVRAKKDVISSLARAWKITEEEAALNYENHRSVIDGMKDHLADRTMVVPFETMRRMPEITGKAICAHCDLGEKAADMVKDVIGYVDPNMKTGEDHE